MKIAILHSEVSEFAPPDEQDVLVQVDAVRQALIQLGHSVFLVALSTQVEHSVRQLKEIHPDLVFNLFESINGQGDRIHAGPVILDVLEIPYTGCSSDAIYRTSQKLLAKSLMKQNRIPTPPWFSPDMFPPRSGDQNDGWIIKSAWEHASIGLDEDSVLKCRPTRRIREEMLRRAQRLGGEWYAELFIEGREFNLSCLGGKSGMEILPPAEILFENYPPDKIRVVGYRAKWVEDSFEYQHTPRTFDFSPSDQSLLQSLKNWAEQCWKLFRLRGYARVDFRVDRQGRPWVLEINANPCISPESGFIAAARQAGLQYGDVIRRIIQDTLPSPQESYSYQSEENIQNAPEFALS